MPYMTLAVDPLEQQVLVTGFGHTEDECRKHADRTDACYQRTFSLGDVDFPAKVAKWLLGCGLPKEESIRVIRKLGRVIGDIIDGKDIEVDT